MSILSVHDIDQWDHRSLTQVGQAFSDKAQAIARVNDGVNQADVFSRWDSPVKDKAQGSLISIQSALSAHVTSNNRAADACFQAASQLEDLKRQLADQRAQMRSHSLTINQHGRVVPLPGAKIDVDSDPAAKRYQQKILTIIRQANAIDRDLATQLRDLDPMAKEQSEWIDADLAGFCILGHNPDGRCRGHDPANDFDKIVQYAKCAGSVAAVIAPAGKFFRLGKEVGGVRALIALILGGAATWSDFGLGVTEALAEIAGLGTVKNNCLPLAQDFMKQT